jgi:hypothetical protein
MEPEGSLLCSQQPSTGPDPEPIVNHTSENILVSNVKCSILYKGDCL